MKIDPVRSPATRWLPQFALTLLMLALPLAAQRGPTISVSFDKLVSREAATGSVYLLISRKLVGEPRESLRSGPFDGIVLRRDVNRLRAGDEVIFDASVAGHPYGLGRLEPGRYAIQALLDLNPGSAEFTDADGNGRSGTRRVTLDDATRTELVIDEPIIRPRREDVGRVRYRYLESRIVGRQLGTRFFMQTAVVMPLNYRKEEGRRYPVQYWIPGIGEDLRSAVKFFQKRGLYFPPFNGSGDHCKDFILVLLDPNGRRGFHGFRDSAGHGAFREALFAEIIPAIEDEFPVVAEPAGRFLVGRGAGGLAALRLQVENPDFFGGVWALAPDPLSHRDFFGLDLGANPLPNAFTTPAGTERVLVRRDGKKVLSLREQAAFERIVRRGNLLQSYVAMYAPLGSDLEPRPLFHPETGVIDPEVARAFDRHDFLANLEANWASLRASLQGKIHVMVGDEDDFYLHRGVARLKTFLDGAGANASVEILPDRDHGAMDARAVHLRVQREIEAAWKNRAESSR